MQSDHRWEQSDQYCWEEQSQCEEMTLLVRGDTVWHLKSEDGQVKKRMSTARYKKEILTPSVLKQRFAWETQSIKLNEKVKQKLHQEANLLYDERIKTIKSMFFLQMAFLYILTAWTLWKKAGDWQTHN